MSLEEDIGMFMNGRHTIPPENPIVIGKLLSGLPHLSLDRPLRLGLVVVKASSKGANVESINRAILGSVSSGDYDILVGPEYSFFPFDGPLSESKKDEYLGGIRRATSRKDMLVIPGTFVWQKDGKLYNTAYVVLSGNAIHEYHKMSDANESEIAKKYGLDVQLGSALGLFEWGKLKIGIEICADGFKMSRKGIKDRDLQFLISSGTPFTSETVRSGGYIVKTNGLLREFNYAKQVP